MESSVEDKNKTESNLNCDYEETLMEENADNESTTNLEVEKKVDEEDKEKLDGTNEESVIIDLLHSDSASTDRKEDLLELEEKVNVTNIEGDASEQLLEGCMKTKKAELRLKVGLSPENTALSMMIIDVNDLSYDTSEVNDLNQNASVLSISGYSIHVLFLPLRKMRYKTKIRQGPDPYFNEVVTIPNVTKEEIKSWIIRFRLYGSIKSTLKKVLCEGYLFLECLNLEIWSSCMVALMDRIPNGVEEPVNTVMSARICKNEPTLSTESLNSPMSLLEGTPPEILIGLSYTSSTGRLIIDVIKGSNFPKVTENKFLDTFVTIVVVSNKGEDISTSKTTIKKETTEPNFEDKFVILVSSHQFNEVTLKVFGNSKGSLGRITKFGSFCMGNKNSTGEEESHWKDLSLCEEGERVIRWHQFQSEQTL